LFQTWRDSEVTISINMSKKYSFRK